MAVPQPLHLPRSPCKCDHTGEGLPPCPHVMCLPSNVKIVINFPSSLVGSKFPRLLQSLPWNCTRIKNTRPNTKALSTPILWEAGQKGGCNQYTNFGKSMNLSWPLMRKEVFSHCQIHLAKTSLISNVYTNYANLPKMKKCILILLEIENFNWKKIENIYSYQNLFIH